MENYNKLRLENAIKYIGFYDLDGIDSRNRVVNLAAKNKMDYICDTVNRAGYKIHMVSPSWIVDEASDEKYQKGTTIKISDEKAITFCPSFGTRIKLVRNIKILFSLSWLFFWMLINVKRNEKVLVYHVPWLSLPIRWAKSIKGFKLILEVEEIYGDVGAIHPYFDVLENRLLNSANFFIFSTELLSKRVVSDKPTMYIYGSYKVIKRTSFPNNDGKIHLLYAGIIDSHKAGAFNALSSALYLPENYLMHIIGFGEVEKLKNEVLKINAVSKCKVVFDGLKTGQEYLEYCQKCHIGLSTQNMEGKYLESSFPSKILSYLSLGLSVVSSEIECVRASKINSVMSYYSKNNPQSIAQAILNVNVNITSQNSELLDSLDKNTVENLKTWFFE